MATFNGDEGNNTLVGGSANDEINGFGGNDFLQGGGGADVVLGGTGNDTIGGNDGDDWVRGGTGNDTVSGGSGRDSFAFADFGAVNADVMTDFSGGWDNIQLDVSAFTALGANGRFASGDVRFFAGAGANSGHDADDRIVYNTTTGQLWYDADGSGSGAAELIATLSNRATISATDIWIFNSGSTPPPPSSGSTINGTANNDSLVGTPGNDTMSGFGGDDSINGVAGNDSISGGDGNDQLIGEDGNDTLDGGAGTDTGSGGFGDDTYINVESFNDAGGTDTRIVIDNGGSLPDGIENLILRGSPSNPEPMATGNALNNRISVEFSGTFGGVLVSGGAGNDTMTGSGGAEFFDLSPDQGTDVVDGGGGSDSLMLGGTSSLTVDFRSGTVTQTGSAAPFASFTNVEGAYGSANGDLMIANDGGRVLFGRDGGDTLVGGSGADYLNGDLMFDAPFEFAGNDSLSGGGGNDNLEAGGGNDILDGGTGTDTLRGGDDADVFRFSATPGTGNADVITDMQTGVDSHHLDGGAMPALGPSGAFSSGDARFHAAAGANAGHDADDRVVFNSSTGQLWYDADGSGSGAAQLIATLQTGTVAASDIVVVNGSSAPPPPPPPPAPDGTNGTEGNDTMVGGSANDTLNGLGGNDFMQGGGGADVLRGGAGNDTVGGNDGADSIESGAGNDSISGGSGLDMFVFREFGTGNADTVSDFSGNNWDSIRLDAAGFSAIGVTGRFVTGDVRFHAAAGATGGHDADDRIVYNTTTGQLFYDADGSGAGGAELIATLANRAAVRADDIWVIGSATQPPPPAPPPSGGTEGNDTLLGTSGDDNLSGLGGNDSLVGFEGADTLDGGSGVDTMNGGPGHDLYFVDSSSDQIVEFEDAGIDEVRSSAIEYALPSWVNNLTLIGGGFAGDGNEIDNVLTGTASDNSLFGDGGNDLINTGPGFDFLGGGAGNDTMNGGLGGDIFYQWLFPGADNPGADVIDGGSDEWTDWLDYDGAAGPIVANLAAGTVSGGGVNGAGSATVTNIEAVIGTEFNDVIIGNSANNALDGAAGNDTLEGGEGPGFDVLEGGLGADVFVFGAPRSVGAATVAIDFSTGTDTVRLNGALMPALGPSGRFATDDPRFHAAAGATAGHDVDDRVIYNTDTGLFYYDADGSGSGSSLIIGQLVVPGSPTFPPAPFAASDIEVVNGSATPPPPPPPPPPSDGTNGTEGNDTMIGGSANDTLNGLGGNDFMQGGGGADILRGGAGNDTVGGNDGVDQVEGGIGNDRVSGGSGLDQFIFREFGAANADVLTDFSGNTWDSLRFDNAAFTAIGGDGRFVSGDGRFFAAAGASGGHDADDRIVYNTSTGQIYYDADGSGAGAAELVATVTPGAALVATDVWVI